MPRRKPFGNRTARAARAERLEDRRLLASVAEDVFAQFEGRTSERAPAQEVRFTVSPADFQLRGGKTLLGFQVHDPLGGPFDPAAPTIVRSDGQSLSPTLADDDTSGGDSALTIVELGRGRFTATVGGENDSRGVWRMDVHLVGDANGDRRVDYLDVVRIGQLASPGLPWLAGAAGHGVLFESAAGRNRFNPLDVTGDGWVNSGDLTRLAQILRAGGGDVGRLGNLAPAAWPDVNGDGLVSNLDGMTLASHLRAVRRGYQLEADADRDGRITHADFLFAVRNLGDAVDLEPLTLVSSLDPSPARSQGKQYTDQAEISLVGATSPGIEVRLDSDADGAFDDGQTLADADGKYSFQITLQPGENRLRAMVRDRFGQKRVSVQKVVYLPPEMDRALFSDSGVQQMPSVAVHPHDPDHVVVAYMDYSLPMGDAELPGEGYAGIGVAVSRNGGLTWTRSQVPVPAPFNQGAASPVVRFDNTGRVYVTYMAATFFGEKPELTHPNVNHRDRGLRASNGIFVSRSDDGGTTWESPTSVASHVFDGEHLVPFDVTPDLDIDVFSQLPSGDANPNYGNLYVAWTRLYPGGQFPGHPDFTGGGLLWIAVSKDAGNTWDIKEQFVNGATTSALLDPVIVANNSPGVTSNDSAHVAVGPGGEVYVSDFGGGQFSVHRSDDAATTFRLSNHETKLETAVGVAISPEFTSFANNSGPFNNQFRTYVLRSILADPARPGNVYAVEPIQVADSLGNVIDYADIFFDRSSDHGDTWNWGADLFVGPNETTILNDDNGGKSATGSVEDVVAGQSMSRTAIDANGNIAVIWYDSRRDPADHKLDVWGTVSTDGGRTFSSNFRITDVSFDADLGVFTNALGDQEFSIGDALGLSLAADSGYAAWTDTRNGNQDVFFSRFSIDPAPPAPNDRFEPNDEPAGVVSPTELGRTVQIGLPKLAVPPGDEDWFQVEAAATGSLIATAVLEAPTSEIVGDLRLELWDETGGSLLATGDELTGRDGQVLGYEFRFPAATGDEFLIRVIGAGDRLVDYALQIQCLTENLATRVHAQVEGQIAAGGGALYLVSAGASGSLEALFTAGADVEGDLTIEFLDPETLTPVAVGEAVVGLGNHVTAFEPSDAIPQAIATGLNGAGAVVIDGFIGDGPFGPDPLPGDLDYFRLEADANQRISVVVDGGVTGGDLNPAILLYNDNGEFLNLGFGAGAGGTQSLNFVTTVADTYFVIIQDAEDPSSNLPTDPFTPGTGLGPGNTGDYRATIRVEPLGAGVVKHANATVEKGESILIFVSGADESSRGSFSLELTNLDQFTTPENASLLFPAGDGPSQSTLADLNDDGAIDVVVTNALTDTVSVLLGNGDGTFQAPRQVAIGAFQTPNPVGAQSLPLFRRDVSVADFSGDEILDIVATNYDSSDISLLLGNGDGSFQPQRRFDATGAPFSLSVGDFNADDAPDVAVVDSSTAARINAAVLLGRGDGILRPQRVFQAPIVSDNKPFSVVQTADLDGDGDDDLVISGGARNQMSVFLSDGDGNFTADQILDNGRLGAGLDIADANNDGTLDIVNTSADDNHEVSVHFGKGDGTFELARYFFAGQSPLAVKFVDFTSPELGAADGDIDLIVAVSGAVFAQAPVGGPDLVVLPGIFDDNGEFLAFGAPVSLARVTRPLDVEVGDVNDDSAVDLVVVDQTGVLVVFGEKPNIAPNDTLAAARDLGVVVHTVEQTQTIVPGRLDAFYTFEVPVEAISTADQIVDVSVKFEHLEGPGLGAELRDAQGALLASGQRMRTPVAQGARLTLHVFSQQGPQGEQGFGAFTPIIDVLPQAVSLEAHTLLPGDAVAVGGPTASLVLTFQGDRLDPASAQNPAHYTVTFLGGDDALGGGDDQPITVAEAIYNPGANRDVSSGRTFPTAVRQTVNLLFDAALPAGSYRVELSSAIQSQPFNAQELSQLADLPGVSGHPVASFSGGAVIEGDAVQAVDLVLAAGAVGDFSVFETGTRFLTQLQNDLSARLDELLAALGDHESITGELADQVIRRFDPALGPAGARRASMLVVILDPVDILLADEQGNQLVYDQDQGDVDNDIEDSFVEVGNNVEVIVIPNPVGDYDLEVSDLPALPRGAVIVISDQGVEVIELTEPMRQGETQFLIGT